jgi:hypothetical protein
MFLRGWEWHVIALLQGMLVPTQDSRMSRVFVSANDGTTKWRRLLSSLLPVCYVLRAKSP